MQLVGAVASYCFPVALVWFPIPFGSSPFLLVASPPFLFRLLSWFIGGGGGAFCFPALLAVLFFLPLLPSVPHCRSFISFSLCCRWLVSIPRSLRFGRMALTSLPWSWPRLPRSSVCFFSVRVFAVALLSSSSAGSRFPLGVSYYCWFFSEMVFGFSSSLLCPGSCLHALSLFLCMLMAPIPFSLQSLCVFLSLSLLHIPWRFPSQPLAPRLFGLGSLTAYFSRFPGCLFSSFLASPGLLALHVVPVLSFFRLLPSHGYRRPYVSSPMLAHLLGCFATRNLSVLPQ